VGTHLFGSPCITQFAYLASVLKKDLYHVTSTKK